MTATDPIGPPKIPRVGPRINHVGNDPAKCCLPGASERVTVYDIMAFGEPLASEVADIAAELGLDPHELDWHVEAVHGWEPHDEGYTSGVRCAADCLRAGGCADITP